MQPPDIQLDDRPTVEAWVPTTRSRTRQTSWPSKAKEAWGDATDDPGMEAEGKMDQAKSDLKQAGEKVKDAFK